MYNRRLSNMKNGDISNVVQPRLGLVFEGALGHISKEGVPVFNQWATEGDWQSAWQCWNLDRWMSRKMWDVVQRQGINVNVVTYIGYGEEGSRQGLQDLLDDNHLPVSDVLVTTAELLSREIAYMPDLVRIYDANPDTAFMYGHKGFYLTDWQQFGR
jgi:hypothetical protein